MSGGETKPQIFFILEEGGQAICQSDACQENWLARLEHIAGSVGWIKSRRAFLVRSYKVERDNQEPWEGSQVIGWDPRNKEIRSWTFDSDGSFDEGTWSRHGDTWHVALSRTLENGGIASATQVLKKTGADSYTVQMVAREVNGDPVPSSEVLKVIRASKKPGESK